MGRGGERGQKQGVRRRGREWEQRRASPSRAAVGYHAREYPGHQGSGEARGWHTHPLGHHSQAIT